MSTCTGKDIKNAYGKKIINKIGFYEYLQVTTIDVFLVRHSWDIADMQNKHVWTRIK